MPSRGDQRVKEKGTLPLGSLTTADNTKRMTNSTHMEQPHKQRSLQAAAKQNRHIDATAPADRTRRVKLKNFENFFLKKLLFNSSLKLQAKV